MQNVWFKLNNHLLQIFRLHYHAVHRQAFVGISEMQTFKNALLYQKFTKSSSDTSASPYVCSMVVLRLFSSPEKYVYMKVKLCNP